MSDASDPSMPGDLRSFGRRRGRKPSPRQQRLFAGLLPRLAVDPAAPALSRERPTWLEIGFGGGEHLVWQAERHPGVDFIGCEPFEDGVIKVLTAIEEKNIANIRLLPDDARVFIRNLPEAALERIFILFPDPWPKRKHRKRRLINDALLLALAHAIRPGGELRIATDIPDYARTMLMAVSGRREWAWTATRPGDWLTRPHDWPATRYERKAVREGRRSVYLTLRRIAGPSTGN
jgi:tRNA (guanine-N7-)-methyltransferase